MPIQHPEPLLEGGDAARGQALYAPCTACHGLDGSGNQALGSPPINHQNDWYMLTQLQHFKSGVRGTAPGDAQGALMRPMSMTLPDEQAIKDVIAFIMTLSKTQAAK
jgi:cytochrome c553